MRAGSGFAIVTMGAGFLIIILGALLFRESLALLAGFVMLVLGFAYGWFSCRWSDMYDFPP